MPNLGAMLLPVVLVWSGVGWSRSSIAAQSSPQLVDRGSTSTMMPKQIESRLLMAKKCTLKRYRRPH